MLGKSISCLLDAHNLFHFPYCVGVSEVIAWKKAVRKYGWCVRPSMSALCSVLFFDPVTRWKRTACLLSSQTHIQWDQSYRADNRIRFWNGLMAWRSCACVIYRTMECLFAVLYFFATNCKAKLVFCNHDIPCYLPQTMSSSRLLQGNTYIFFQWRLVAQFPVSFLKIQ